MFFWVSQVQAMVDNLGVWFAILGHAPKNPLFLLHFFSAEVRQVHRNLFMLGTVLMPELRTLSHVKA